MNQTKKLEALKGLSYFDKATLGQLVDLSTNSLYAAIKRWLKAGRLVPLKKGWYVTHSYLQSVAPRQAYMEFMANRLRAPSYLSVEYVLQKHAMLSESIYATTSVTLKGKRCYTNAMGTFVYHHIKPALFTGFLMRRSGEFELYEATKAKALFDYLYLRLFRCCWIDRMLLQSYRLNLDEFSSADVRELRRYCEISKMPHVQQLPNVLRDAYDLPEA